MKTIRIPRAAAERLGIAGLDPREAAGALVQRVEKIHERQLADAFDSYTGIETVAPTTPRSSAAGDEEDRLAREFASYMDIEVEDERTLSEPAEDSEEERLYACLEALTGGERTR